MPDAAILFAGSDYRRAAAFVQRLKAEGLRVVGGPTNSSQAEPVSSETLATASIVLVIWSAAAISDAALYDKAYRAFRSGRLFNIRFDKHKPPRPLQGAPTTDLSRWRGEESAVIDRFAARLAREVRAEASLLDRFRRRRGWLAPVGAIAGMGLAILGVTANLTGIVAWLDSLREEGAVAGRLETLDEKISRLESNLEPGDAHFADRRLLSDATRKLSQAGLPIDALVQAVVETGSVDRAADRLAAELALRAPTDTPLQRVQGLHQLGAIVINRDPQRALTIYKEILDLAPQDFEAHERIGVAKFVTLDIAGSLEHFSYVTSHAEPGSYAHTEALLRTASVMRVNDQFEDAAQNYEAVIATSKAKGFVALESRATTLLAQVEFTRGNHARAGQLIAEIMPLQQEAHMDEDYADSLSILGDLLMRQGDFEKARAFYQQGLDFEREMQNAFGVIFALDNLGLVDLAESRPERAQERAYEMLAIAREHDMSVAIWRAHLLLAESEATRGRGDRACRTLEAANKYRTATNYKPSPRIRDRFEALACPFAEAPVSLPAP